MTTPARGASTDEVALWLLGPGHLSCLDADGRPLGERASPRYDDAPKREAVREFGDSRDATGLPCNLAALAQLTGCWSALRAALSSFESDRAPTTYRALRRAEAAMSLAPITALRTGAVPRSISALHKSMLGYGEVLTGMILEARVDADAPLPSTETLMQWLDERPWLIGDLQVCAGTRKQIGALWEALAEDASVEAPIEGWSQQGEVVDALEELWALAAVAAGAARVHLAAGAIDHGSACAKLAVALDVPRTVRALRQIEDGGPLHPTLLFPADAVPTSVRALVDAIPAPGAATPFTLIDAALVREASAPADRLMRSVGRDPTPLTRAAFAV